MRVLGIVLAISLGLVSWRLAFALGGGISPLGGPADALDLLLFWAPLVGTALPIALLRFAKGAEVSGAWVLAVAPLLGLLNVFLSFAFYMSYGGPTLHSSGPVPSGVLIFSALWQMPWLYVINALRKEDFS